MYAYTELKSRFDRSSNPNKLRYNLENNTQVVIARTKVPQFGIFLHDNCIAYITQDKISLYLGNYRPSMTTKDRLNKILSDNKTGYTIYQEHFNWYVWGKYDGSYPTLDYREHRIKFYDGMTFIYETSPKMVVGWRLNTE